MELKDKLKKLRQERNMTQSRLAETLYVSRSTVAKWESGLGQPNPEALEALERLYGITAEQPQVPLQARSSRWKWAAAAVGLLLAGLMLLGLITGNYGFTPEAVTGFPEGTPYWENGSCRIYYTSFAGDWEDGRHWEVLTDCKAVRKRFLGWARVPEPETGILTLNNLVVGRLYSIPVEDGYCSLLCATLSNAMPAALVTATSVRIRGTEYPVENCIFFVTPEPVEHFFIGQQYFDVQ